MSSGGYASVTRRYDQINVKLSTLERLVLGNEARRRKVTLSWLVKVAVLDYIAELQRLESARANDDQDFGACF